MKRPKQNSRNVWECNLKKLMKSLVWRFQQILSDFSIFFIEPFTLPWLFILWRVSTRIFLFFEIWTESYVWVIRTTDEWGFEGLRGQRDMNEYVGILNRTNNITRSCFFPFLYICIIHTFFSFKRKHNCANRQTKNKTNTTKKFTAMWRTSRSQQYLTRSFQ